MSSAIRILPIIRPWASFFWRVCLAQIHHLPASMLFARFHFPGAGSAPGRCRTGPEAARLVHNPKGPCPELQRWHGRGPAHLIPAKCAGPPARFRRFGMLSGSISLGAFGPMQRGAVPRCRGAPNGSCITQTLGCGKTQYDPGKIKVPTLNVHAK